jgi:hypothetical protein
LLLNKLGYYISKDYKGAEKQRWIIVQLRGTLKVDSVQAKYFESDPEDLRAVFCLAAANIETDTTYKKAEPSCSHLSVTDVSRETQLTITRSIPRHGKNGMSNHPRWQTLNIDDLTQRIAGNLEQRDKGLTLPATTQASLTT